MAAQPHSKYRATEHTIHLRIGIEFSYSPWLDVSAESDAVCGARYTPFP